MLPSGPFRSLSPCPELFSWHLNNGNWLLGVYSLGLTISVYLSPQVLLIMVRDPSVGLRLLALRWEGYPKLRFLSGLSAVRGATHRVFPLPFMKSPYQMVWSIFCTPWLQNFISAKIPLIVHVDCWKFSWKSRLRGINGFSFYLLSCHPQYPKMSFLNWTFYFEIIVSSQSVVSHPVVRDTM